MQSSALHLMSCENALAKIRGEPPVWPQDVYKRQDLGVRLTMALTLAVTLLGVVLEDADLLALSLIHI